MGVNAFENVEPRDHHEIVPKAAEQGVTTIVTSNIGPRSYDLISPFNLQVVLARNVTVQEAIEKLRKGELKVVDAPTLRHSVEERELLRQGQREQYGMGGKRRKGRGRFTSGTPRGRHHLQQYSGRGH